MEKCDSCFTIKCRGCGWEPTSQETILVQKKEITACPLCGWIPGAPVL